jgi:PAS domain S-box-containing protein
MTMVREGKAPRILGGPWSRRLLVIGLGLAGLVLAAVILASRAEEAEQRSDAEHLVSSMAQAFEERTIATFKTFDRAIRLLRAEYLRSPASFFARAEEMQRELFSDQIIQISVIGPDGYWATENRAANDPKVYLGDREHFRVHMRSAADDLYVSAPVLGRVSKKWTIQLTRKILRPDGSLAGVLVLSASPSAFGTMFESLHLGTGGGITLVGYDGFIRSRVTDNVEDAAAYTKRMPSNRAYLDMARPPTGLFLEQSPVDNVMRITAYRRLPDLPLAVLVHVPEAEAVADAMRHRKILIPVGLALALIIVAAAAAIGRLLDLRVRSERVLTQSEQRYRSLFSSAKVVMLLIDPDEGRIVDANAAAIAFYGYGRDRLCTMRIFDLNCDGESLLKGKMGEALTGRESRFFFRHRLSNGDIRDVEVHSGPIDLGERPLIYSIIHDVTDSRRVEAERRRLALAMEQTPAAIVITDVNARIEYVNPAFLQTTGYGLDEVLGCNPRLLKSEYTSDQGYAAMWAQLSSGVPWSGVFRNRRKGGELYWERAHISPVFDESGQITHYLGVKENITEQRRAEEVIRTLNRRFQDLMTAASEVAIVATDKDGLISLFNTGAQRMLGYDEAEMVGRKTPECFHLAGELEARAKVLAAELARPVAPIEALTLVAAHQGRETREWTYLRKDGSRLTVSTAVTPVRNDEGELTGFLGVAQDVTASRQAEARLRESEERFRSLVEGTTDWVWETDENHRFTWFSTSFETVVGVAASALIGKRRWDVTSEQHEIQAALWEAHIADLTAHRLFRDFRYWIRTGDGQAKWISISGSPRFDDGGRFLGYRGAGSDITAKADISLRLRMMSKVVEQSPVSVVITNPDGVIEFVNQQFTHTTGYAADEAMGSNISMMASGDTPAETYRDMWTTIRSGASWAGELKNRKKDGSAYWETIAISPILDEEGHISHYAAVLDDVTYRKEAEQRLAEANRRLEDQALALQRSNEDLEQFAYVASHDLKQPLRMVSSYLTLIQRALGPDLSDDLKTFLGFAIGGATRMDAMIRDLLEFSRIGRSDDSLALVDLNQAVAECLVNLKVAIEEAGAAVTIADGLPTVMGDGSELVRLFQNLIGNAVKYRAPDRAPLITVGLADRGTEWELSVTDNGIGIRPEDFQRAFAIFQRVVGQSAGYEGTGIGLSVCKKIVEHHGGRIWIESAEGAGSCFRFTLPKTSGSRPAATV